MSFQVIADYFPDFIKESFSFIDLQALFTLQKLKKLNISDNEIRGLPPTVSNLVNLIEFDTSKNGKFVIF